MGRSAAIEVGDAFPALEFVDGAGQAVCLPDDADGPFVLFFYPRDGSPVCTVEACAFRDAYADFTDAGVAVFGVSSDSIESHRDFARRHDLPFRLLTDAGGAARKALGVPSTLGVFPGRVTYVVDGAGVVRLRFASQMNARKHVDEALRVLRSLSDDKENP